MPDFTEGQTQPFEYEGGPVDVTEVIANTPAAVGLLEVFASNRMPQGSTAHHNDGRASTRLFADDLADLKSAAAAQGLTWQAAPRAERSGD
jgi:hypothetical protein